MADSTLALPVLEIQKKLVRFAGWPSNFTQWPPPASAGLSPTQIAYIDDAVGSGLRRFYFPTPVDQPELAGYEWSFLRPQVTLDLPSGASKVQLPDNYAAMSGTRITLAPLGTTSQPFTIQWANEGRLRALYSMSPSLTGPPMYVSLLPIAASTATSGQRFQLYLFPAADQEYTLQMTMSIAPNMLDGSSPWAFGGPAHTETIIESCLAILEERLDDLPSGAGPHSIAFEKRLMASITMDRRNKPPRMGYNNDHSDDRHYGYQYGWWHYGAPPATYNGASLDG